MSNYELHLPPVFPFDYNPQNGQFRKGHKTWNKGKTWDQMGIGKRKQKKIRANLEKGRKGRPDIGGNNKKAVVGIWPDGTWRVFPSAARAAEVTGIIRRNIGHVCQGKRKHAGGVRWFYENDNKWCNQINKKSENDN